MKKYAVMFCAMLAMGALTVSCSSEDEAVESAAQGKGAIKLSLNVGADFQSRSFSESDYANTDDYTVQIQQDGKVIQDVNGEECQWTGATIPDGLIELNNGSYTVVAFKGEEYKGIGATTEGMYVEGKKNFDIQGNQETEANVNCIPQCARVTVNFDKQMADYFKEYSVVFTGTKALGESSYEWKQDYINPVYMAVTGTEKLTATIKLTDKEGKTADNILKSYDISAAKALKLNIVPSVQGGNLGIAITIDDSTNPIDVDIEIPSDWL